MKKLLTLVIALLMLTLPLAMGLAETAATPADDTTLVMYEATDLGFSFYYPQTWNAPVADAADANSLTLSPHER